MKRELSKFFCGVFAGFAFIHVWIAIAMSTGIFEEPVFLGRPWSAGYAWAETFIYIAISVALGYVGWRRRTAELRHVDASQARR